ncbi:hypothetical protein BS78_10G258800 [Paspalum vaginatum]|nr:hypothetical protein BS78_10G258800 [Paspalum vaginatum]
MKRVLQEFANATGLVINYGKTTFLSIGVENDHANYLASLLDMTPSSFPQPYLGLPLTPYKFTTSDFFPLIDSCDRYLAGWKASLLNRAGRLVLCSSVLNFLPLHYMSAMQVPRSVLKTIDGRRRAFFWTGEDKCHGSKCLVAWEDVCKSKQEGGLGLKKLETQNHCLLMKFVDKILDNTPDPWKAWFGRDNVLAPASLSSNGSYLGRIITEELDHFRSCTSVALGDGSTTSFWFDCWLHDTPLCTLYPALFSHVLGPDVSVQFVLQRDFDLHLRPRLTTAAAGELTSLMQIISQVQVSETPDERWLRSTTLAFSSRGAYAILSNTVATDDNGQRIWKTKVPNKVKIFAWLFFKNRLSTRENLHRKHVQPEATCCRCNAASESWRHIFIQCPFVAGLWQRLGINMDGVIETKDVWSVDTPSSLCGELWEDVVLTLLWLLWESRNGHVFRQERLCVRVLLSKAADDLKIWRSRFPIQSRIGVDGWRSFLVMCNYISAAASSLDAI